MKNLAIIIILAALIVLAFITVNNLTRNDKPLVGVPVVNVERRALYDLDNNFSGYRIYDPDMGVVCYLYAGDISCVRR